MEKLFKCFVCGKIFEGVNAEDECDQHEKKCEKTEYFRDDFSGEVITYKNSAKYDQENEIKKNQCHVLKLVEIPKYGSDFEGKNMEFHVTDEGLISMCKCLTEEAQIRIFDEVRYPQEE